MNNYLEHTTSRTIALPQTAAVDSLYRGILLFVLLFLLFVPSVKAQGSVDKEPKPIETKPLKPKSSADMLKKDAGYVVKTVLLESGERIPDILLPSVYCFSPQQYMTARQRRAYNKLVRDVKAAYPYSRIVAKTLIETYEYLQTMETEEERMKHLKRMEKELYKQYFPELKKLTFRQGKILLKLINRECNSTSFDLIDAYLGGFAANFWQLFAKLFGASLKTEYNPEGEDRNIETIVLMIESGAIPLKE